VKPRILIVDDELSMCTLLSLALRDRYEVRYAIKAEQGMALLEHGSVDVVLLDLIIGDTSGIDLLRRIKAHDRRISVIMITAFGTIKSSVEAVRNGAFTYLTKPLDMEELTVFIEQALAVKALGDELDYLSYELKSRFQVQGMIGNSRQIQQVHALIEKLKEVDSSVIITGESGTGKELVARALHFSGKRNHKRFIVINCAAIPESLLEEELFGHKRGTFTGATEDKKGKFEVADHGTIFLDEIGDMPLSLQSKLLRVLQQKEFTPLGSTESVRVDVRIIAATNKDLEQLVNTGTFREDLFYRLNVMNIIIPPLRERKDDIPLLCEHFISRLSREQNKNIRGLSAEAQRLLVVYDYPGNVRQLANILEHAVILSSSDRIDVEDLPETVRRNPTPNQPMELSDQLLRDRLSVMTMKEIEQLAIEATLEKNAGRRDRTAADLGISVRSLLNKTITYGLH
jgi:two-component system response regulator AtoC